MKSIVQPPMIFVARRAQAQPSKHVRSNTRLANIFGTHWVVIFGRHVLHIHVNGVAPGLQSAPGWATKLESIVIVQLNSLLHQLVNVWGLNFRVQPRIVVMVA